MFYQLFWCLLVVGNPMVNYNNSDLVFHLNRIIGLKDVLTYPINFKTFNQIGYGINYFYPWLTLYPIILLVNLFHSIKIGYIAFLISVTALTGIIAYFSGKQIYNDKNIKLKSFVFAVLYMFLNYRLLNIYRRFDIGELIAMSFVPMVIAALYSILIKNKKCGIQLALGMAFILYSHVLTTILMIVVCILMTLFSLSRIANIKDSFKEIVKAGFIFALLSLGFILPYLQQAKLGVTSPFLGDLQTAALPFNELINNSLSNTLGTKQITIANLGLICVVFLLIGLVNLHKTKDQNLFYILGLIFTILTTNLFPWGSMPKTISLLQFPWRFMTFAAVFLLLYGVSFVLNVQHSKFIASFLVIISIMLQLSSINLLKRTARESDFVSESKILEMLNWNNLDYLPLKSEKEMVTISNHAFYVGDKKVNIPYKVYNNRFVINVPNKFKGKDLNIPIEYYIGTKTVDSNGKKINVSQSKRGTVEIKSVSSNKITITSEYSKKARLGQLISLFTLMFILLKSFFKTIKLAFKNKK